MTTSQSLSHTIDQLLTGSSDAVSVHLLNLVQYVTNAFQ